MFSHSAILGDNDTTNANSRARGLTYMREKRDKKFKNSYASVSPNKSNNQFFLNFTGADDSKTKIEIYISFFI